MTDDITAFRAALKAAGEPWQQRGIKVCSSSFVGLVVAQLSAHFVDRLTIVLAIFAGAIVLLAIGWSFLIVAFVKRRQWAKEHGAMAMPDLPKAP